jgi:hypothetical protein
MGVEIGQAICMHEGYNGKEKELAPSHENVARLPNAMPITRARRRIYGSKKKLMNTEEGGGGGGGGKRFRLTITS